MRALTLCVLLPFLLTCSRIASGHSQGGAVCLHFLRKPRPSWLLGIVTSNSFLADQSLVYNSARAAEYAHMPVYMMQGTHDTMINFEWGRTTAERLEELGFAMNFVAFDGVDHDLSDAALERLLHWIKEALPAVAAQDAYSPISFRVERDPESDRRARILISVPEGAEEQLAAMPVFACGGSFDLRAISSGILEVQVWTRRRPPQRMLVCARHPKFSTPCALLFLAF